MTDKIFEREYNRLVKIINKSLEDKKEEELSIVKAAQSNSDFFKSAYEEMKAENKLLREALEQSEKCIFLIADWERKNGSFDAWSMLNGKDNISFPIALSNFREAQRIIKQALQQTKKE